MIPWEVKHSVTEMDLLLAKYRDSVQKVELARSLYVHNSQVGLNVVRSAEAEELEAREAIVIYVKRHGFQEPV